MYGWSAAEDAERHGFVRPGDMRLDRDGGVSVRTDDGWTRVEAEPVGAVDLLGCTVEDMNEGWLVKGTRNPETALAAVDLYVGCPSGTVRHAAHSVEPGRYRKVPSQWGSWRLHDATGRGSFEATIVRCYKIVNAFPREGLAGR
jgi:hypothetical protein